MSTINDLYKPQLLTAEGACAGIRKYQEKYKPKIQLTLSEYIRQAWHVIEPTTKYLHNWHIDVIAEYLQAVDAGEVTRLLLTMPPRYSKSICISIMWPTWSWINHPDSRWLFASYSSGLSTKHSVDRRIVLTSEWYRSRWGAVVELAKDQNEKNEFQNTRRGVMVATSVGGSATGRGGSRLVIDDPTNPEGASSEVERKNDERWFDQTISTRLDDKVSGAIVVVMQRLHQSDIAQHCIDLGYTHLNLPAVSEGQTIISLPPSREMEVVREDGELLWPEREDEEGIKRARLGLGEYGFASQYQQRPVPLGGGDFKKEWFNIVDAAPPGLQLCRSWDCAATAGGGDYTVGVLMGRSREGKYYVLSLFRGQWSPAEVEKRIIETAHADGSSVPIRQEQEGGSSGKAIIMDFTNKLAGYDYAGEKPTGAKTTRWNPFARQAEAGNVSLVKAWWNKPFLDELSMAPHGRNDDIVDSASAAFNYLALSKRRVYGDCGLS